MPAPLTRTLNTSPSTSTSNSAEVAGGEASGAAGGGAGAADHVVDSLRRDHLTHRRHERRVAELEADAIGLVEHLGDARASLVRSELAVDVLEHQPGHVVAKDVGVDAIRDRADVGLMRALQGLQRAVRLPHAVEVEPGVVLASLQGGDDALGRRL